MKQCTLHQQDQASNHKQLELRLQVNSLHSLMTLLLLVLLLQTMCCLIMGPLLLLKQSMTVLQAPMLLLLPAHRLSGLFSRFSSSLYNSRRQQMQKTIHEVMLQCRR